LCTLEMAITAGMKVGEALLSRRAR
jgi:hypothetical protein